MERQRSGVLDCLHREARSYIVEISSFDELFVDFVIGGNVPNDAQQVIDTSAHAVKLDNLGNCAAARQNLLAHSSKCWLVRILTKTLTPAFTLFGSSRATRRRTMPSSISFYDASTVKGIARPVRPLSPKPTIVQPL
jgi:hypothetical protein